MSRRDNRDKRVERAEKVLSLLCGETVGLTSGVIFTELGIPQPSGAKLLNLMADNEILRRADVVDAPGAARSYFWVPALDVGMGKDLDRMSDVGPPIPPDRPDTDLRDLPTEAATSIASPVSTIEVVYREAQQVNADVIRYKLDKLGELANKVRELGDKVDDLYTDLLYDLLGE